MALLHTIIDATLGLLGFAATVGGRMLISPRLHRAIQRKIRDTSITEMERNLALFEQTRQPQADHR